MAKFITFKTAGIMAGEQMCVRFVCDCVHLKVHA